MYTLGIGSRYGILPTFSVLFPRTLLCPSYLPHDPRPQLVLYHTKSNPPTVAKKPKQKRNKKNRGRVISVSRYTPTIGNLQESESTAGTRERYHSSSRSAASGVRSHSRTACWVEMSPRVTSRSIAAWAGRRYLLSRTFTFSRGPRMAAMPRRPAGRG